jgi:alpha-mannosidase
MIQAMDFILEKRVMQRYMKLLTVLLIARLVVPVCANAQLAQQSPPDLTKEPTLYVVPYAHLDTQWRWDYPTTIREYLPATLRDNFALFEKYPSYIFNFSGANRYRMIKEYYPADYAKMKQYIAAGRWFPAGSSMEENDVNSPSAESTMRQILYGTQYFRSEFGKTSAEYMLPDCFGFPASLPSILAHMGLKGFSTQKLSWNSAMGIPFNVGYWEGLDGKGVVAALNAMTYSGDVRQDISKSPLPATGPNAPRTPSTDWPARIQENAQKGGLMTDYYYYGTGDIGGSPREPSVALMEAIVTKRLGIIPLPQAPRVAGQPQPVVETPKPVKVGDGPVHVVQGTAEQMFLDIKPDQLNGMQHYKGDLLLSQHSAGSITSQTYMKRWNRQNEVLADAAERASVAADWLGGRPYPLKRLTDAWTLVMGGQFHDIIPGTSIPKAYEYAWNDELLALNQFAGVLTSATDAVSSSLNTQAKGAAVVVFNPLNIAREDIVEAAVAFAKGAPQAVRVTGPDGKDVAAQLTATGKVLFLAKVPSSGYAVFDVQAADAMAGKPAGPALTVTESTLENARYRIKLDQNGDVASLFDKSINRELLSAPIRLAIKTDKPVDWPAWNMDWADQQKPPRAFVQGTPKIRVVESGPARVAIEVVRETEGSVFAQTIRLAAGDAGNRVEFGNVVDWKTAEANLKATFSLTASNPQATYNWDIGTIQRGNDDEKKFEVPSHQWFDLTDKSGAFGVTVLQDSKNASDKPDDNTLRLTLMRTPGIGTGNGRSYADQSSQDWGHHEFVFGLAGHAGDWRQGQTDWQAWRLNQPLLAFEAPKHSGALGTTFSLFKLNNNRVRTLAVKHAEQSDEIVVRMVELDGKPAKGVSLSFAGPIASAREITGAEQPLGPATVTAGALVTDFSPYQIRSFALKLRAAPGAHASPVSHAVTLAYDRKVASNDHSVSDGAFDGSGRSLPAEMLPRDLPFGGIRFKLARPDTFNAIVTQGQTIALPAGAFTRVYLLAAADGDQKATFRVGDTPVDLTIQDWGGFVGQWDNRIWKRHDEPVPPRADAPPGTPARTRTVSEYAGLTPGYVKGASIAWFASHRHLSDGSNDPYAYSYLFAYAIDIPVGATTVTLPTNNRIRILAMTVSSEKTAVRAVTQMYDALVR